MSVGSTEFYVIIPVLNTRGKKTLIEFAPFSIMTLFIITGSFAAPVVP